MYTPPYYKLEDQQFARDFIREHSFGLLLTSGDAFPLATHLPFVCREEEGKLRLFTHLSKANPQSQELNNKEVVAVFTGPHAYISATWYKNTRNVPTWNYAAVHVKGIARVVDDSDKVLSLLRETVAFYEAGNTLHHEQLPEEYKHALSREICMIEIETLAIEITVKFNQNKPKEDLESVIAHLQASGKSYNLEMAELIKKFNAKKLE
ncbi:MAG: Negative transcriptional regulator, family protein [Bacteroidetes bacterium]|jgi:transcriptional regulator|nr:Negative transcriptional regulator, family protein [Bacteroidota bacterium]